MTVWVRASDSITGAQVEWSHPSPCSSSSAGPRAGLDERATMTVDGVEWTSSWQSSRPPLERQVPDSTRTRARTVVPNA